MPRLKTVDSNHGKPRRDLRSAGYAAAIALIACCSMAVQAAPATNGAVDSFNARTNGVALDELRRAWLGQLNELIAKARDLAVADDTYEFVKRPNIPYVDEHYDPEQLAAARIDTVLIVNLRGEPLFWRRVNQGPNRGFPDARQFLAELPKLDTVGVAGAPSLAGAAELAHGPKLLVAMPIYESGGSGVARGWLIAARALDPVQWRQYEQLAHEQSSGFVAVADLERKASFHSSIAQPETVLTSAEASPSARSVPLLTLILIGACVPFVVTGMRRRPRGRIAGLRAPNSSAGAQKLIEAPDSSAEDPSADRLAAGNAVFRFQPQIDLQTGRVAGVEAILCVPGARGFRPAIELVSEIEASGHGLALAERSLRAACREQSEWVRRVGHEFPIGVSVSQRSLSNPAFLPLVQRILADNQLAPSLLELQVEEAVTGAGAVALRVPTFNKIREAGISIAVDGFNAAHSNLRLLSLLPISKLRVDSSPLLRRHDGSSAALLFAGIAGAARGFGIKLCATGVNSPELLSAVLQHGRHLAQGAAIGPIQTSEEFLELLRRSNADTATVPILKCGDEGLQLA
jgi:EAL domain-containing protein (putative c-di-GMP-specific phosphodiesterase class I)